MSFKSWVTDLPSTNYKAFISVWLSVAVVLVITTCIALKRELQTEALYAVFIFLGGMIGADVTQFIQKRKTTIVTPPEVMAENTTDQKPAAQEPPKARQAAETLNGKTPLVADD